MSLDNLHDIMVVDPVSLWWPLAPGWWVILGVIALIMLTGFWRYMRNRHRNAYRRYALKELNNFNSPSALPVLLKRVALVAYPREQVASLSGQEWIDFLNHEVPNCFTSDCAALLFQVNYLPGDQTALETESLISAVRRWVLEHPRQEGRQ